MQKMELCVNSCAKVKTKSINIHVVCECETVQSTGPTYAFVAIADGHSGFVNAHRWKKLKPISYYFLQAFI